MAYTKLLNMIINESGLSVKEIAEKCGEYGVKITAPYISTLKNDTNNRSPSDEVSRAIAKACGYEDENELVIEAYIDNAPEEFSGVFELIKSLALTSFVGIFSNEFSEDHINTIKELFDEMPLSKLITTLYKQKDRPINIEKSLGAMNISKSEDYDYIKLTTELKQPMGFPIKDNSMFPVLPMGSQASVETTTPDNIKNGDIAVVYREKETLYRKIAFLDEEHTKFMLYPINTEFDTIICDTEKDKVLLVGKVTSVTTTIK